MLDYSKALNVLKLPVGENLRVESAPFGSAPHNSGGQHCNGLARVPSPPHVHPPPRDDGSPPPRGEPSPSDGSPLGGGGTVHHS